MAYIYLHSGDFRANVGTYIPYMEDMGSDFKSLYLLCPRLAVSGNGGTPHSWMVYKG